MFVQFAERKEEGMELLFFERDEPFIPHEVVELVIKQNLPLIKAWRLFKGLSVEEVAAMSDLRDYEVMQLESADNYASFLLEKMAVAMGLNIDQVVDL